MISAGFTFPQPYLITLQLFSQGIGWSNAVEYLNESGKKNFKGKTDTNISWCWSATNPNFRPFNSNKSTSFPDYFGEKIISIDKIPAFLQAFKHVISMFTTAKSGIWVGPLVTSLWETLKRLLTELLGLSKHFWVIWSYLSKLVKELYHLHYNSESIYDLDDCDVSIFSVSKCGSPVEFAALYNYI